jgi:NAD(P)H-dependent flavin oxidoreductase YrpB (nitropropane dioxygenase family)
MSDFVIIQGGMGVGVSGWPLALAVSRAGQLGVVSGTGLAVVLARRLQEGDPGGHLRRAMGHFPVPGVAGRVLDRYFLPEGRPDGQGFRLSPMPQLRMSVPLTELTVVANFVEVFLAKEGHGGAVGINYLEKIQVAALPSIYGAMLAGVGYVLMGAGIPRWIPGVLDAFSRGEAVELKVDVDDAGADDRFVSRFSPAEFCGGTALAPYRPKFLAVISSATLAMTLARKSNGRVDGFVVEGSGAGGHNAPPRGPMQLNERGEPSYGPKDAVDLGKIRELGLPYWLAGGFGHPDKLARALADGASGVQVGTAFAFCQESGVSRALKLKVLEQVRTGSAKVFTDPAASPTGFPFKVVQVGGTLSDEANYTRRRRTCDLGYLRKPYRRPDGTVGYRCSAEPVEDFVRKGGDPADTVGRKCVCNALFGTIGLGQVNPETGDEELPLVTAGDDLNSLGRFLGAGQAEYTAADVVAYLLQSP